MLLHIALAACALTLQVSASTGGSAAAVDLQRARAKVPRQSFRGFGGSHTAAVLNGHLEKAFANVRPCEAWTARELQGFQQDLWSLRHEGFGGLYTETSDPRALHLPTLGTQIGAWEARNVLADQADKVSSQAHRDGHCYEAVMWMVHHLSSKAQHALGDRPVPSLPSREAACDGERHPELCAAVADQHSCMYCHSLDEGTATDIPVPDHKPGHTDTVPVFPKRFVAKTSGWSYYNENGPNQSGKISNQTYTMSYYYDWPNNRMRQDTVYNSTYPSRSGVTWFNGTTQTWYIIEYFHILFLRIPLCIKMPPPIKTVQRPDWVMAAAAQMPGNGSYVGREPLEGRDADHWLGTFYRENPVGMKSNASFDIWFDPATAHIRQVIGKCDPPDAKEGSPTEAMAHYDSFEEVPEEDTMNEYFDDDKSLTRGTRFCIPITPTLSSDVIFRAPGIPAVVTSLLSMKEVQDALPEILAEYGVPSLSV